MPKSDELDKAGELLVKTAQDMKNAMDAFGPQIGKRSQSTDAVAGMIVDLAGQLGVAAEALVKVGTQLRTAAAELESADDT
jgi:hypothetical protein